MEGITQKTGSAKRFPVFVKMLLDALGAKHGSSSETVFVDLLAYADLVSCALPSSLVVVVDVIVVDIVVVVDVVVGVLAGAPVVLVVVDNYWVDGVGAFLQLWPHGMRALPPLSAAPPVLPTSLPRCPRLPRPPGCLFYVFRSC